MSPRNYFAKFTTNSDLDFWWRFSPSNTHYNNYEKNKLIKKNSIFKKIVLKFKKDYNKDFI